MPTRKGRVRTLPEVARALGVPIRRVERASQAGDIEKGADGRYSLAAAAHALAERETRGKGGSVRLAPEANGNADPLNRQTREWDMRFRRARAVREERLVAQEAAELVRRSEVTEYIIRRELEFKDRCLGMPREVALSLVCGCPLGKKAPEIEAVLREKMVEILRVLAKPEDVGRVQGKAGNG